MDKVPLKGLVMGMRTMLSRLKDPSYGSNVLHEKSFLSLQNFLLKSNLTSNYFDLLKVVGKNNRYSPNGGLMMIYHGIIRKKSP